MVIKSEFGIYRILERYLRETNEPLTCVELFDRPDVKKYAKNANKVSDYLGHMWRRDLLDRYPAPKTSTSLARWAYTWKNQDEQAEQIGPVPRLTKPRIQIDETDSGVTITFPAFVISIRSK